jgi:hypothetical protein
MNNLTDWLADIWMRRCPHDQSHIAADILEGSAAVTEIPDARPARSTLDKGTVASG